MSESERYDFACTAFKRLYWEGYTGKFGMFDWPTESNFPSWDSLSSEGLKNYDRSEYTAYKSAPALETALASLQANHSTHVLAHSMGTVVTSEALDLEAAKPSAERHQLASSVVFTQGAYAANAYDATQPAVAPPNWPVPDLYSGSYGNIGTVVAPGGISNFYNPKDFAVGNQSFGAWKANQSTEQGHQEFGGNASIGDDFTRTVNSVVYHCHYEWDGSLQKFVVTSSLPDDPVDLNDPDQLYSLRAFGLGAFSDPLGSAAGVGGPFNTGKQQDLSAPPFNFDNTS